MVERWNDPLGAFILAAGATGWVQQSRVMMPPIKRRAAPVRPAVPAVLLASKLAPAPAAQPDAAAASDSAAEAGQLAKVQTRLTPGTGLCDNRLNCFVRAFT